MCEEKKLPVITPAIEDVLTDMQSSEGMARLYQATIAKMFNKVLMFQDELEMSAQEAMATLRTLCMLGEDLATLSRSQVVAMTSEEVGAILNQDEDNDDDDDDERNEC